MAGPVRKRNKKIEVELSQLIVTGPNHGRPNGIYIGGTYSHEARWLDEAIEAEFSRDARSKKRDEILYYRPAKYKITIEKLP